MLKPINFKNSIRGENIQYNFEFLEQRIRSEALSSGGRGIIEGMEITVIDSTKIYVSPGRYIDAIGDEVSFPGGEFRVKRFEPVEREAKAIKVNALGQAVLPSRPYSRFFGAYFTTGHYDYLYPTDDLTFKSTASGVHIKAVKIEDEVVTFDAGMWAGREINAKYLYARNRMDTVLVSKDKGVVVVTGTMSPSMSHIDLSDYKDYIIIGMLEISIDKETEIKVHYTERQERPIYVDVDNNLFLNGTEYRRIFFEMPEIPKQYDVYIDYINGDIYSYIRDKDGNLGWVKVNGPRTGVQKEVKIIAPDSPEYPKDLQTFMFDKDDDLKYRFIPGLNQLEVIIDNAPLMSDQYEEVTIDNGDLNNGFGFKLKDPLDKPAYVEIRVTHNTDEANVNKSYQRSATFSKENIGYVIDEENVLFEAAAPYEAGEYQLEVYLEGQKVYKNLDYFETDQEGNAVPDGGLATHFKFAYDLKIGDEVVSRVTKNIYSYDHIAKIIENSYGSIKEISDQVNGFTEYLQLSLNEVDERLFQLESTDETVQEELKKMDNFVKKTDVVSKDKIDKSIVSNVKRDAFEYVVSCESIIDIEDLKLSDLIFVFKISNGNTSILLKDLDYTLQQSGDDMVIILEDSIVDTSANILVKGVKFGV